MFLSLHAQAKFSFNENCVKAYKEIISLKLGVGQTFINAERKTNPSNAIPILLDNYTDFLRVLTMETKEEYERFKLLKSKRIELLQKEDKNSPYFLYCQAEINLQSCIQRFKFQEYVNGAYELQKAYKQLEENQKKYPDFLPNQKSFGLLYALIGLVPDQYKWALSTIGLKGNVQEGIIMLEKLKTKLPTSPYAFFMEETVFFLSFIQMGVENKSRLYEEVLKNTSAISTTNLLNVYVRSLVALRTGHTDEAISLLTNKPKSPLYTPFYQLDYLTGLAKLNRFDSDAIQYFESYLKNYKGCFNVKDTYLKMGWFYLLKGNIERYKSYITLCKLRGDAIAEKDKEALNEAQLVSVPDLYLLKARLCFDGGYYDKALNTLKDKTQNDFKNPREHIEFVYRLGRIHQALTNIEHAVKHYTSTISQGMDKPYYFAANASLQLGYIFENRKEYEKARYYYSLCSKMKNQEYKQGIDAKAKAGLKRISGKN